MSTAPILKHPDLNKPFKVYTDASNVGLGVILAQDDKEGKEKVVAFEARSLNPAEANLAITEKEYLAVVWVCKKFHHFIEGWISFTVYIDY